MFILTKGFVSTGNSQYAYSVKGMLTAGAGKTIYISPDTYIQNTQKRKLDSTVIDSNNEFRFQGTIPYAGLYSVFIKGQNSFQTFFLDTIPVIITGNADSISLSRKDGSVDEELCHYFSKEMAPLRDSIERTFHLTVNASRHKDSVAMQKYKARLDSLNKIEGVKVSAFIRQYPSSYQTLNCISAYLTRQDFSYELADTCMKLMPIIIRKNPMYVKTKKLLSGKINVTTNSRLPSIKLSNSVGKIIDVDSILNRYPFVLIDFWASWCKPCRQNNPALQQLKKKYNNQLQIVSISLDDNLNSWTHAIASDNMDWINISDLKGWDSEYALLCGINALPSYFLISNTGKIILKTTGNDTNELLSTIKELIK